MLVLNVSGASRSVLPVNIDQGNDQLLLEGSTDPLTIDDTALAASVIEIRFPAFHDGRGLSLARYLRLSKNYRGLLRASGALLPDQLSSIFKLGFDEVVVDEAILSRHGEADWLAAHAHSEVTNYQENGTESIWQRRAQSAGHSSQGLAD